MSSLSVSCQTAASPTRERVRAPSGMRPLDQASREARPSPGRTLTVTEEKPVVRNAQDCPSPASEVARVIGAVKSGAMSGGLRTRASQAETGARVAGAALGLRCFAQL